MKCKQRYRCEVYDNVINFVSHQQFNESSLLPRTVEIHSRHCDELNGPFEEYNAVTNGVVRNSILNECRFFHVITGMPPDIMHDTLEGMLQVTTLQLLRQMIHEQKRFRLHTLNSRIVSFPYGPDSRNKPVPLKDKEPILTSLKQSGKSVM